MLGGLLVEAGLEGTEVSLLGVVFHDVLGLEQQKKTVPRWQGPSRR